jgi:hypothetical protein
MYTSVVLFALAGALAPEFLVPEFTMWQRDYALAQARGNREHRPLAVFIGQGKAGWQGVSKEGQLTKEVTDLLAAHYVCVYVDRAKEEGRQLARSFEMADRTGLVLSDHTGESQAFRHAGELSNSDLEKNLRKFADPNRAVLRTETTVREEIRYYPPPQPFNYYPPVPFTTGRSC